MKYFLIPSILLALSACVNYQQIQYQRADLFSKKRVQNRIDNYEIFVHQNGKTVKLENPVLTDSTLSGEVKFVSKFDVLESPKTKEEIDLHKNDMHVYLASVEEEEDIFEQKGKTVTIPSEEVTSVKAVSTNEKEIITGVMLLIGLTVLAAVLIVAVVAIIIAAMVAASNKATGASSDGSGASSDGSGASSDGSNGSSDGSSGSSDGSSGTGGGSYASSEGSSGGSGSCYIATMAYGGYDEPEVLDLRRFRDDFLKKRKWGRDFIAWYYLHSPSFVEKTRNFKWLHRILRFQLNGFIHLLKFIKVL